MVSWNPPGAQMTNPVHYWSLALARVEEKLAASDSVYSQATSHPTKDHCL